MTQSGSPIYSALIKQGRYSKMLLAIVVILAVLWALGFAVNIGGGLIHILLVAAVVVFIYNMVAGRKSA